MISQQYEGRTITVSGTVQGVGFRPFIYTLALSYHLRGSVCNTATGVRILIAGETTALEQFSQNIRRQAPPLAHIDRIETEDCPLTDIDLTGFFIIESLAKATAATTCLPPDIATCPDCLADICDPTNRRYRYPFTNCTNCGPRFSIIEQIPYDRPATSMKAFAMCPSCHHEYLDPQNRRFHAQPNACPQCGPSLSWHDAKGEEIPCPDVLDSCTTALKEGAIVALRGLGGFHLCCDGCNTSTIVTLRLRKKRPDKPLALMMPDLATVESFCHLDQEEQHQLLSPAHPIVLLKKRDTALAANISPHITEVGIMLPYTPLHHLLFSQPHCPQALVMTSGNQGGLPICTGNKEALEQLSAIADYFLLHNREIVTRVDDSVLRVIRGEPRLIRRARGYCPTPLQLNTELPQAIACGGGLKSTFCLGRGTMSFISQHIGDLNSLENFTFYLESIAHHQKLFEIEPKICIHDLHPDYMSSQYGKELAATKGLARYTVQHHHAHAAAVMAEHHLQEEILAIVFDGTGLGDDGTLWGGEILQCDLTSSIRRAHISHLLLPGGDRAAMEPWRMALSALSSCSQTDFIPPALTAIDGKKRTIIQQMIAQNLNSPKTSSCGRLFDAVAALLGIRLINSYEGQAAMELESLACQDLYATQHASFSRSLQKKLKKRSTRNPEPIHGHDMGTDPLLIDSHLLIDTILHELQAHTPPSTIALNFHLDLIIATTETLKTLAKRHRIKKVVVTGGCMQNRILLEGFFLSLESLGLEVYTGEKVPINDGGLSVGQLIVGGMLHRQRQTQEESNLSGERKPEPP